MHHRHREALNLLLHLSTRVAGHDDNLVDTRPAQGHEFPVTVVHNPSHAEGQQGSVRLGLAALSGPFDAVFVMPSDQPLIAADDLIELIGAFKKRAAGHVVIPFVNGQRGNPILLDELALAEILTSDTNLACRHLIDTNPELVHVHETGNTHFITDLDTPGDLQVLAERTGWRLEMPA